MNHAFITRILFGHCDEPGILAVARIELASTGEPLVIDESTVLSDKRGRPRLEVPTCVHSSDGSFVIVKLPKRLYESIQADVIIAYESWLRKAP